MSRLGLDWFDMTGRQWRPIQSGFDEDEVGRGSHGKPRLQNFAQGVFGFVGWIAIGPTGSMDSTTPKNTS